MLFLFLLAITPNVLLIYCSKSSSMFFFRKIFIFTFLFIGFCTLIYGCIPRIVYEAYIISVADTGHNDTVSTVAFSSDGKLVACGSMDGQINVWNTATRTLQGTLEGSESGFEVR